MAMRILPALLFAALLAAPTLSAQIVYAGTYTDAKTKGIYAYRFDDKTGKLTSIGLVAETPSPSFLAVHPNGKYLYAVNELTEYKGKSAGSVSGFSIDHSTGKLTLLNSVSSGGAGPCHLVVDHTGKELLVANYFGGSFASFPIEADGKLGEAATFIQEKGSSINKERQSQPHGHSVVLTANNKYALAADLGTDKVMIFRLDPPAGKMTPNEPAFGTVTAGGGPRHIAIAPDQKHAYVLNEMGSSVSLMTLDADKGVLKEVSTVSALPGDFRGKSSGAEIMIDARGRHVYTSNRGHNSIAVFDVDPKTAALKLIQNMSTGGSTPRGFVLSPSGSWLISGNQDSGSITVFKVDKSTGKLTATEEKQTLGSPVTFAFIR